jgi:uncharacterized protein involved in exopolysaccharide biosynthesis
MSVHSAQEPSAGGQWDNPQEIDLARYLNALGSRWLEILLTTLAVVVVTAAGVLIYRALTPPLYEATTTVAIVRTSTDVRFDERFTTTSEQQNLDANSRRTALIALVGSGSIAQQVIDELGATLPARLQDPAELLEIVAGEMALTEGGGGQSDLINIIVNVESPELAATIANAWAAAYVQQVNRVYGQVPDEMLRTVAAQMEAAQQTYQQAQERLETHLATSPLATLIRQANAISATLNTVQGSELRLYHDQWLRTNSLLLAARTLGEQVSDADADLAGLAPALQVLQVQMVNAAATVAAPSAPPAPSSLPSQPSSTALSEGEFSQMIVVQQQQQPPPPAAANTLQLQLNGDAVISDSALRSQVAATIAGLEAQLAQLEASINQAAQSLGATEQAGAEQAGGLGASMAQLDERLRALQSSIEVENARTLEFTEQRDLAWESVQALSNKQAELLLAQAAANSEVRLSSAAVPLDKPVEQVGLVVSLVLATLAGLLLGVVVALLLELANVPPLRGRRAAA